MQQLLVCVQISRSAQMSRKCEICGRGPMSGNNVSHANNKTRRVSYVNLQQVRAVVDNRTKKVKACTRCIRNGALKKKVR